MEWLNGMLPHLNLPLEASEEELRACLSDGTVLCSILNKLSPGLVEMVVSTFVLNLFGFFIFLFLLTFYPVSTFTVCFEIILLCSEHFFFYFREAVVLRPYQMPERFWQLSMK